MKNNSNNNKLVKSNEYKNWINELKQKFRQTQIKAAIKVNTSMLEFYWDFGCDIIDKQKDAKWGSGFLKGLSNDLTEEFPDVKGFSEVNLSFVRRWVKFYTSLISELYEKNDNKNSKTISSQLGTIFEVSHHKNDNLIPTWDEITKLISNLLFQVPWGHNKILIGKTSNLKEALFYVNQTIKYGWSRVILTHQIESGLFEREGKAVTNFTEILAKPQSDLANEIIKDPYKFDFLSLGKEYNERDLEDALLEHITKFLLELGAGFAFLGKQKALQVGEREFFIDLLFYHAVMHCYVVVELKVVDFEPEFAGKLNFYLKAVDNQIKTDKDEPTIGILICKSKDKTVVEYALSDIYKPIAVSEYHLTHILPDELKSNLPTIEEIEAEFKNSM